LGSDFFQVFLAGASAGFSGSAGLAADFPQVLAGFGSGCFAGSVFFAVGLGNSA
jgi:hypothetical protein